MAKITKHAEFLDTLRGMVNTKQADVAKEAEGPKATGKPGADTHFVSVSDATDTVNKNEQGRPEKNPQDFNQKPSKDKSDPSKKHAEEAAAKEGAAAEEAPSTDATKEAQAKTTELVDTSKSKVGATAPNTVKQTKAAEETPAEDVDVDNGDLKKMANEILSILKAAKEVQVTAPAETAAPVEKAAEGPTATGKPGADTHFTSISDKHDTVNKNEQGRPEKNPQEFHQKPSTDKSDPTKKHAAEVEKQASYELGRQFCRSFLQNYVSNEQQMSKAAGRRDFETLIAQAAAELDTEKEQQVVAKQAAVIEDTYAQEKQAEEAGAQAFYTLLKQAQDEYQAEQVKVAFEQRVQAISLEKEAFEKKAKELEAKLAEKEAAMAKKAEEEKRAQEFSNWGNYVVEQVIDRLQRTTADK